MANALENLLESDFKNILKKLDETEEKLVKSERNYVELWRKYEKSVERSQEINHQLEKSEKARLEEMVFQQSKL
jgi:hypothetical protein